jgi:hypothetical protein
VEKSSEVEGCNKVERGGEGGRGRGSGVRGLEMGI